MGNFLVNKIIYCPTCRQENITPDSFDKHVVPPKRIYYTQRQTGKIRSSKRKSKLEGVYTYYTCSNGHHLTISGFTCKPKEIELDDNREFISFQ